MRYNIRIEREKNIKEHVIIKMKIKMEIELKNTYQQCKPVTLELMENPIEYIF